jgi:hypothetical protein
MTEQKRLHNFLRWFVPPGWEYILRSRIRYFLPFKIRKAIAGNRRYQNVHKGKRCFILATGPSIAEQDIDFLANETCFSVGQFYLHPKATLIKPAYHVEAPLHPPFNLQDASHILESINKIYNHDITLFIGHTMYSSSFSKLLNQGGHLDRGNIELLNYSGASQLDIYNYRDPAIWDISKTPFTARTVIYSAIQVAAFMGFSEIYLLGCDHDYLKRYFDRTLADHHCYPEYNSVVGGTSRYVEAITLESWFGEYYFRWLQYRLMASHLNQQGQYIYNATRGGMLDVFPRVDLEEVRRGKTA